MEAIQSEKIELFICCRDLKNLDTFSKSDPQVRLYLKDNDQWVFYGKTEVVQDNLNPVFDTTFIVNYSPNKDQKLLFEVIDIDGEGENNFDMIGKAETLASEIFQTKKDLLTLDLMHTGPKPTGELVIRAEKVKSACNIVCSEWAGVDLANKDGIFSKSDPFLQFYKIRKGGDQMLVYESEYVQDNLSPNWKPFKIRDYKLCENDYNSHFKVECWDYQDNGQHQYIGGFETCLNELKNGKKEFDLYSFKEKKKTGKLVVKSFALEERPPFSHYIKSNDQLNTIVAIDFSKANSSSKNHALVEGELNDYQKALKSVCEILLTHDKAKTIPVYGFGAKLNYPNMSTEDVSHYFSCNAGLQQPDDSGTTDILEVYSYAVKNVEFSSPTCFAPLLTETIKTCEANKNNGSDLYTILVILTAGEIKDLDATIDCIEQAACLPLSIIIIGIGKGDFSQMETLDGDQGLNNKKGEQAKRDLVQFVSFKNFRGDMDFLSQRVLAEIPDQVVDYMKLIGKN